MREIFEMIKYEIRDLKKLYQKITDKVEKGIILIQWNEWLALRDANMIGIGVLDYEGTNRALREAIQTNVCFNIDFISNDILSLLHELGHMQTINDYEDEMENFDNDKAKIDYIKNNYEYQKVYYENILIEKVANEWASQYINDNEQMFIEYAKQEKTIAKKCYKRVNKRLLKKYNIMLTKVRL